jgi:hypothetical protein
MGANDVKKRRSQAARSSKVSKASSPNEGNVTPKSGASSTEAAQANKLSHPNETIPAANDLASNATATKNLCIIESHVPNAETARVLREAREGKNLLRYESLEEMFKDLGI